MEQLKQRIGEAGIDWVKETGDTIYLRSLSGDVAPGLVEEVEFHTGKAVVMERLEVTPGTQVSKQDLPFVSDLDEVIRYGLKHEASDIHIERYQHDCHIRLRIDGILMTLFAIRPTEFQSIVNKVKIRSSLDISEKRLPQDGRIHFRSGNDEVELRVSIIPAIYGEKVVMRYLRNDVSYLSIDKLGLNDGQQEFLKKKLQNPSGLVLLSGPTGSGKTTTLYSILKHLNTDAVNILTIEDPIEYSLPGINQVQLKDDIGLTYPHTLRAFLRQDPDIIMVGEIRDVDTAQMAIRASLTGHLVLSTIHANSTVGIVNRLVDMGVPFYQIKSALRVAGSQRLVRTYCPTCMGKGCDICYQSGYKGRRALFEFMDARPIADTQHVEDLKYDSVEYVGGSMRAQLDQILNQNLTSRNEVLPIYDEFS